MTPAEEYAQKRTEAVALIRQHAPPRLQDALIELLRPAIALSATHADDSQIPLGASKFGGAPDVPPNFEWPTWNDKPLGFLAQINLEEVAPFDVETLLPESGLISFFYEWEEPHWGEPDHKGAWRVYFFDCPLICTKCPEEAAYEFGILNAALKPRAKFTLPQYETIPQIEEEIPIVASQPVSPELRKIWKLYELLEVEGSTQMFGCSNDYQGSPGTEAAAHSTGVLLRENYDEMAEKGKSWLLLLQIPSDDALGALWGDGGTVYFMIHADDLAARRFEKAWHIMQC